MSQSDATIVSSAGSAPVLQAPDIPDVTIERELGRGGMGAVWLGRQTYLGRQVAVKALLEVADTSFAVRFRREATILAGLHHPHIVACHSAGIAPDGRPYLVMEFVDGPDLKHWVAKNGPLPPAAAARVVREVAEGLAHAHAKGIIHRDVKPENVLLASRSTDAGDTHAWTAKLADLGLARPAQTAASAPGGNLTAAGQIVGTPATMAPEQFDDPDGVDHRADIYGLGCVLYYALTGAPAFTGKSFAEIVASKVYGSAPDPQRTHSSVPARLSKLCANMLDRDRAARPQDYTAIIAGLRACELDGGASAGLGLSWRIASMVGVVAVVGVAVWWIGAASAPTAPTASPAVVAAPTPSAVLVGSLPPLQAARMLFEEDVSVRLRGWDFGPGADWGVAEEHDGRAVAGLSGWIARSLPGLPIRLIATIEVPKGDDWEWWLAGVRLADGQLVAVRAMNLGSNKHAKIETWRRVDLQTNPSDSTVPRDLMTTGGGQMRLDIRADRISATIGEVGIGDMPLSSPPVALVFAGQATRAIIVVDPVAEPLK